MSGLDNHTWYCMGRALLPQGPDHTIKAGKHYDEEAGDKEVNHNYDCFFAG